MNADQKEIVDDLIESILGHDHARLADVMFEMVKNDEHYRVLAKHRAKEDFVMRYIQRLVGAAAQATERPAGVEETALLEECEDRPCEDDFDYVGGPQEDSRPCADDFDYVGGPQDISFNAEPTAALPCTDDFDYVGPVVVPSALPVEGEELGTQVELRPRGNSAAAEELETLGPASTQEAGAMELRPRGNTAVLEAEASGIEAMDVAEPLESMRLEQAEPTSSKAEALSGQDLGSIDADHSASAEGSIQVAKELKEIAPPVELVELATEERSQPQPSSLFTPAKRGGLFADTSAAPINFSTQSSAASTAQRRLKTLNQMKDDSDEQSNEEEEFSLKSSSGVQAKSEYQDKRAVVTGWRGGQAFTTKDRGDPQDPIAVTEIHPGIAGNYKISSEAGKWTGYNYS